MKQRKPPRETYLQTMKQRKPPRETYLQMRERKRQNLYPSAEASANSVDNPFGRSGGRRKTKRRR